MDAFRQIFQGELHSAGTGGRPCVIILRLSAFQNSLQRFNGRNRLRIILRSDRVQQIYCIGFFLCSAIADNDQSITGSLDRNGYHAVDGTVGYALIGDICVRVPQRKQLAFFQWENIVQPLPCRKRLRIKGNFADLNGSLLRAGSVNQRDHQFKSILWETVAGSICGQIFGNCADIYVIAANCQVGDQFAVSIRRAKEVADDHHRSGNGSAVRIQDSDRIVRIGDHNGMQKRVGRRVLLSQCKRSVLTGIICRNCNDRRISPCIQFLAGDAVFIRRPYFTESLRSYLNGNTGHGLTLSVRYGNSIHHLRKLFLIFFAVALDKLCQGQEGRGGIIIVFIRKCSQGCPHRVALLHLHGQRHMAVSVGLAVIFGGQIRIGAQVVQHIAVLHSGSDLQASQLQYAVLFCRVAIIDALFISGIHLCSKFTQGQTVGILPGSCLGGKGYRIGNGLGRGICKIDLNGCKVVRTAHGQGHGAILGVVGFPLIGHLGALALDLHDHIIELVHIIAQRLAGADGQLHAALAADIHRIIRIIGDQRGNILNRGL